jgi:hypothetical protein
MDANERARRKAQRREHKLHRARYGMKVSGRSVRRLQEIILKKSKEASCNKTPNGVSKGSNP